MKKSIENIAIVIMAKKFGLTVQQIRFAMKNGYKTSEEIKKFWLN